MLAFYNRDLDSMKAAGRMQKFLPKTSSSEALTQGTGVTVDCTVTFSRTMYAQLKGQAFQAPRGYPMPPTSDPNFVAAELGMKLACGFEMLYSQLLSECPGKFAVKPPADVGQEGSKEQVKKGVSPQPPLVTAIQQVDSRPVVLPGDRKWEAYRASLEKMGYFRSLLPGSREHTELLGKAVEQYRLSSGSAER